MVVAGRQAASGTRRTQAGNVKGGVPADGSKAIERVFGYLRVSTEEQARTGLGLGAQRERITAMATVKGWPAPLFLADEGISGTKDTRRRPALARLMHQVEAGQVDAVIVNSLDRLARNTRLTLELVDTLNRYGVVLVSCKESLDTTTPQGQFFVTIIAGMAQLERDMIAERTRAALAEHGRRDGERGGRLPYGYVRTDLGLRLDRHAASLVRKIFALRDAGQSLRAIAAALPDPGPRGGAWAHTSVREILANENAYRGGLRGESAVRWPVILDQEDHQDHTPLTSYTP